MRHWVSNPRGLGGLACRPHDRFAIGAPGTPQCGAKTRRTGKPCRAAPVSGSKRCYYHGGMSSGRCMPALAKNDRQFHSKAVAAVKRASRAYLRPPAAPRVLSATLRPYVGSLYAPSIPQALLACDDWTRRLISRSQFEAVLEMARQHAGPHNPNPKRWKRRAPLVSGSRPPPAPAGPKPEPIEAIQLWASPKDRDRNGW